MRAKAVTKRGRNSQDCVKMLSYSFSDAYAIQVFTAHHLLKGCVLATS